MRKILARSTRALYQFLYLVQIFEWVIYVHFIRFQGKYRIEQLFGLKKNFNSRECKIFGCFIFVLILSLSDIYIPDIIGYYNGDQGEHASLKYAVIMVEIQDSAMLFGLLCSEIALEYNLKKHYRVQYLAHKNSLRIQLFLFIISLAI